jgi:transposase InsO family protein
MRTLQKTKQHVVGMTLNTNDLQTCHDCIASKIVCRSFPKSISPQECFPLDLLHMDIKGKKYVLFLTDDHSGLRFGFPIASRSGNIILECLQSALPYMEQQSGNTLKAIRSDNALEFTKGAFAEKLREIGIQQEHSLPYEHEQVTGGGSRKYKLGDN